MTTELQVHTAYCHDDRTATAPQSATTALTQSASADPAVDCMTAELMKLDARSRQHMLLALVLLPVLLGLLPVPREAIASAA